MKASSLLPRRGKQLQLIHSVECIKGETADFKTSQGFSRLHETSSDFKRLHEPPNDFKGLQETLRDFKTSRGFTGLHETSRDFMKLLRLHLASWLTSRCFPLGMHTTNIKSTTKRKNRNYYFQLFTTAIYI